MDKKNLGLVCVKEKNGMIGVIVDGDLRRNSNNLFNKKISEISNKNPVWISEDATALTAIEKMTTLKISSLLVTNGKSINKKNKKITGVITTLQCLRRGIKWK